MAAGEGFEPSHTESESAVVLSSFIIWHHFVSFVTDEHVFDLCLVLIRFVAKNIHNRNYCLVVVANVPKCIRVDERLENG